MTPESESEARLSEALTTLGQQASELEALRAELKQTQTALQCQETALQQAEARYQSLFASAVVGIFQASPQGYYLNANPALANLYGYGLPEQLIAALTDIPQQLYVEPNRWSELVEQIQARGKVVKFESAVYRRDGQIIWISESVGSVNREDGTLLYYEGFVEEITERKQAEAELAASQQLLKSFMDSIPGSAFIKDAEGRYLYVNANAEQLVERTLAEIVGKTDFDLFPAAMAQQLRENDAATLASGQTVQYTEVWPQTDRDQSWLVCKFPFEDADGQRILAGLAINITEQKRTEEALRQSEERHRLAAELASDYTYAFNLELDGTIRRQWTSSAFERITGFTPEECDTRGWHLLPHPDDRGFLTERMAVIRAGQAQVSEYRILTKSGKTRWLRDTIRAQLDPQRDVIRVYGAAQDITERKQAEQALRLNEERLRLAVEQVPIDVFNQDRSLRYTWACNLQFANSVEELLGKTDADLFQPEDAKRLTEIKRRVLETGIGARQEVQFNWDGEIAYFDLTIEPFREGEQVVGILGAAVNITERKRTEQELRQAQEYLEQRVQERTEELAASQAQMQAVLDNTPAIIYILGVDGRMKFVNAEWYRVFGPLFGNSIEGRHLTEFLTPEHAEYFLRENQKLLVEDRIIPFENDQLLADGIHTFLRIKFPLKDTNGEVYAFCGVSLDITQRKQIETALKRSEAQLRAIVDHAPLALYITSAQGTEFVNQYWIDWMGLASEESPNNSWLQRVHPEDRARVLQEYGKAKANNWDYGTEYRLIDSAGKVFWVMDRIVPIHDEAGQVLFQQGFCVDITERKQNEERLQALTQQLQQQNEQLKEVSRLKSDFLTNMSHELRTPLTSILGFSSVLLRQVFGPLNAKQQEYLSLVHSSGTHLLALINDLLDLAKIEAGRLELNQEIVNLLELCQGALRMVEVTALSKRQQLSLVQPLAIESIVVDGQRVLQMLLNYLSNAVKFTPEGGTISLSSRLASFQDLVAQKLPDSRVEEAPRFLVLSVQDSGIGVAPEDQHLLFQVFQQVDGGVNRRYEGTGLGLALTRLLAELHGGTVSFTSTLGVGSTFSIWLPLEQPAATLDAADATTQS
ncbi:PAS domain-containing sensor histidine kinase [Leptolyngbya sp. FACHB-261]|uniref:PAS domain-containing sensor histidine kinase n=1 Tax=Leptolyngbya sp. FACHB-261 TaxID=2692806 RepID=UPI0016851C8F|nr:PAS domain-containing sensor histidine kinase [Leptolyngbya sp. FACHB-261]MBD2101403.1 PAS domain S-box protein [Leptolyngbya sp. FACHB-261]